MNDTIYRQDAIDAIDIKNLHRGIVDALQNILSELPSAQQDYDLSSYSDRLWKAAYERGKAEAQPTTLYGYRIEILALIATIMEKEKVTPEKAIEYFTDIDRMVQMIRDEEKELLDRALRWSEGQEA